jgi:4-hydroxy-3-polyprenylbenzoate decarboxylase
VPLDTLDFTSFTMNLGSKMVVDATVKQRGATGEKPSVDRDRRASQIAHVRDVDHRILDLALVHDTLLLVKVGGAGRAVLEKLVQHTQLPGVSIIAAVSEDVNLADRENYIWGIFTRFDCERDVLFTEQKLIGISPVYRGVMAIDATWKPGYPEALKMTEDVRKRVDRKWGELWR